MNQNKTSIINKTWFLPVMAAIMIILAFMVVYFIPENTGKGNDLVAEINEEGNLVIYADRLSTSQVSFINVSDDSPIELLARLSEDGTVKAALGTCQSCNGSPKAYYTQEGEELICNNCGLTFPISVLDAPGGGCHPIMIDEKLIQYEGNNMVIDLDGLAQYEMFFLRTVDR